MSLSREILIRRHDEHELREVLEVLALDHRRRGFELESFTNWFHNGPQRDGHRGGLAKEELNYVSKVARQVAGAVWARDDVEPYPERKPPATSSWLRTKLSKVLALSATGPDEVNAFDGDTILEENVETMVEWCLGDGEWDPRSPDTGNPILGMVVAEEGVGLTTHDAFEDDARPVRALVLAGDGTFVRVLAKSSSEPVEGNGRRGQIIEVQVDADWDQDELTEGLLDHAVRLGTPVRTGRESKGYFQTHFWAPHRHDRQHWHVGPYVIEHVPQGEEFQCDGCGEEHIAYWWVECPDGERVRVTSAEEALYLIKEDEAAEAAS
jgi:hypothetical protein